TAISIGDNRSGIGLRGIMAFDTSVIPATAQIADVKLQITRGSTDTGFLDPLDGLPAWMEIKTGAFNGDLALEGADYGAAADGGSQATTPMTIVSGLNVPSTSSLLPVANLMNRSGGPANGFTQIRILVLRPVSGPAE